MAISQFAHNGRYVACRTLRDVRLSEDIRHEICVRGKSAHARLIQIQKCLTRKTWLKCECEPFNDYGTLLSEAFNGTQKCIDKQIVRSSLYKRYIFKYADAVSCGEGITMIVRLTGGKRAQIETPVLIFINKNLPDGVPGFCYRTSPKGLLTVRLLWNTLNRNGPTIVRLGIIGPRTIFLDNCSGHNTSVEIAKSSPAFVRI